jgi:hypothetical protein
MSMFSRKKKRLALVVSLPWPRSGLGGGRVRGLPERQRRQLQRLPEHGRHERRHVRQHRLGGRTSHDAGRVDSSRLDRGRRAGDPTEYQLAKETRGG